MFAGFFDLHVLLILHVPNGHIRFVINLGWAAPLVDMVSEAVDAIKDGKSTTLKNLMVEIGKIFPK
jgi:hypothetical protein